MGELIFVGLGLNDEKGISLRGLEETRTADSVFIELYTSLLPDFSLQRLEDLVSKEITLVSRQNLEEENGVSVLMAARQGKTVLLVPGDPFVATTHVTLRIEAEKKGIRTRIIHGASIISAIIGSSGLHNYKFGKTVTVPFPENSSETPYNVIRQNKRFGLHTLCLLDLRVEERRFLTAREGLELLFAIERRRAKNIMTPDAVVIGLARVGSERPSVKADFAGRLLEYDLGSPPHSLILVGQLHFMEAEALISFAGAPNELRNLAK